MLYTTATNTSEHDKNTDRCRRIANPAVWILDSWQSHEESCPAAEEYLPLRTKGRCERKHSSDANTTGLDGQTCLRVGQSKNDKFNWKLKLKKLQTHGDN